MVNYIFCSLFVVGDSRVGLTAIVQAYINKTFDSNYTPTVCCDVYKSQYIHNDEKINVKIIDLAGQRVFDSIRKIAISSCIKTETSIF